MAGIHVSKTLCKSNTEFPFTTVYFLGVRRLKTSSYIVYDYTTSGYMDLQNILLRAVGTAYINFHTIYIYISNALKF